MSRNSEAGHSRRARLQPTLPTTRRSTSAASPTSKPLNPVESRSISCWPPCGIKRCRLNAELTRRRRPHPMFIHGWQRQSVQKWQFLSLFKSLPTRLCCSNTQMSSYGQKGILEGLVEPIDFTRARRIRDAPDSAFSLSSAGSDHADPDRSSRQCNRRQKLAGSISQE